MCSSPTTAENWYIFWTFMNNSMHMPTNRWLLIVLFIGVVLSCRKPKHTPGPVDPSDTAIVDVPVGLSFLLDSVQWTATSYYAEVNFGSIPDTVLTILVRDSFNQYLQIRIHNWRDKIGSYDYYDYPQGSNVTYPVFFYDPNTSTSSDTYGGISGNITFTKVSHDTIQGKFSAIAAILASSVKDTIVIANGIFNIPYRPI